MKIVVTGSLGHISKPLTIELVKKVIRLQSSAQNLRNKKRLKHWAQWLPLVQ